ncbi:MAG TPA: prenyltransferase/squalene oxidase repeat-containing protein [Streptomyces sp.]|uniref:prenyltransferase/squalene oxidase repeat-containing protein n=1 Tax=Streptomyces sp. TaxID=1931 RepID=UPI002D50A834|nr:prenyltransferase/squalene oxidase repeat-containing protein [Streptomyces sp.]HZG05187.1 prenyltransferase/squalene oxidase repeat-containing protein [Streptomyces sp.]
MSLRRTAAVLAASAVLCAVAAPVATADESPSAPAPKRPKPPSALYGKDDPQYDGVWRQSLALLAQDAVGVRPAEEAVEWLTGQQCADGAFTSYRPDPSQPCNAKTVADVNATAAAVQALAALGGHDRQVGKAVEWLKQVQNQDGGWGYNPGGASDANSVSVVIGALVAAGEDPAKVRSAKDRKSPYDSLLGFQLGCGAKEAERGAFAYQPDAKGRLAANDDATAAAVLAALGEDLVVEPGGGDGGASAKPLECGKDGKDGGRTPAEAAEGGAAYLTRVLRAGGGHLTSAMPGAEGQPDYGNTADAVIALAAGGHRDAARASLTWLEKNAPKWDKFAGSPAALGQLVLATRAVGGDPADFGGTDLVERLNATGPRPASVPADGGDGDGEDSGDGGKEKDGGKDGDGSAVTWSFVGAGLAAGAGIGFLLSLRNRRRSQ